MTKGMAANGCQGLSGFAWTMLFLNNIFEKKTEAIVPICSVDTGDPVARWGATGPSFFSPGTSLQI